MSGHHDHRVNNDGVKIHYIETGKRQSDKLSLVVSPGIWEPAERALPLMTSLHRHCIAISYRGRGKSDTPPTGYDFEHHISDLAAVIDAAGLESFALLGFSRGVPYATGYTLQNLSRISGLILVDQPPIQNKWSKGDCEFWKNLVYRGMKLTNYIRPLALERIEEEARRVELWDRLPEIHCPVLILRGLMHTHPIPPDLNEEWAKRYLRLLPNAHEVGFAHSGHMIPDDEPELYCQVVNQFLEELDALR